MDKRLERLDHETIVKMFRELREKKNISQQHLADIAGVNHSYISKLETNTGYPKGKSLTRLVNVLVGMDAIPEHQLKKEVIKWDKLVQENLPRKKGCARKPETISLDFIN